MRDIKSEAKNGPGLILISYAFILLHKNLFYLILELMDSPSHPHPDAKQGPGRDMRILNRVVALVVVVVFGTA